MGFREVFSNIVISNQEKTRVSKYIPKIKDKAIDFDRERAHAETLRDLESCNLKDNCEFIFNTPNLFINFLIYNSILSNIHSFLLIKFDNENLKDQTAK